MTDGPQFHAPSLRLERAHRLLQWSEPERAALQNELTDFGERVYLRTILAEMDRHGVTLTPARINDAARAWAPQMRARVQDMAARDATQIMQTRNRLITAAVDRALGKEAPNVDMRVLLEELQKVDAAYTSWKAEQINDTESYAFYQAAFEDFYRENTDLATLFDFTGSLGCDLCQSIAEAGPYTLQGMMDVEDPPHPNCGCAFQPVGEDAA